MKGGREAIYQALFTLLKTNVPGLTTISRRATPIQNVTPEQQPALFMEQIGENPISAGRGIPYKWELTVFLMLYVFAADENVAPATIMNPLVDAIEQALLAGGPQVQTLGGLVSEVRLLGEGKSESAQVGPQAIALIPVRIVTT